MHAIRLQTPTRPSSIRPRSRNRYPRDHLGGHRPEFSTGHVQGLEPDIGHRFRLKPNIGHRFRLEPNIADDHWLEHSTDDGLRSVDQLHR